MKRKDAKLFRVVKVEPFKYTSEEVANKLDHLVGKEVTIVNESDSGDIIYVKEDLREAAYYKIHRKDLKVI